MINLQAENILLFNNTFLYAFWNAFDFYSDLIIKCLNQLFWVKSSIFVQPLDSELLLNNQIEPSLSHFLSTFSNSHFKLSVCLINNNASLSLTYLQLILIFTNLKKFQQCKVRFSFNLTSWEK